MTHFSNESKIWLEFGTGIHRRFINVNAIYENLGQEICSGLPAFHAFTGCDFNPLFYKMGKKEPWILYRESKRFQEAFKDIQDTNCDNYRY